MPKKKGIGDMIGQKMIERPDLDKKIMAMKKGLDEVSGILKSDKKKNK